MQKFVSYSTLVAIVSLMCAARSAGAAAGRDELQTFPYPKPVQYTHHNDDFTVRVRKPGGAWQDLYEYNVKVDLDKPQDASMVYFDFDGTAEVAVQKNNGIAHRVAVRPVSKGIAAKLIDNIAYFTLTRPENLSVEFDGDHLHNLHIFTHAIRQDMPRHPVLSSEQIGAAQTPDLAARTVYFGPGVYTPPDGEGGTFRIGSNTSVYIDGSAILKGSLVIENAEHVKVVSDGLFEGQKGQLSIHDSNDIVIDGPITINPVHGTASCVHSQNVQFLNVRTIGAGQWSDGIGNFSCHDVTISGAFVRTSDDNVTIYNHRGDVWGSSSDITLQNSTLWADIAHNVFIGMHGNTPSADHPDPETIEHVRVSNIDILDEDEDQPEYEGALGITAGDSNLIRDVTFENVRVERIEEGKLFNFHVGFNAKYNTSAGRGIENVKLRNISFTGAGSPSPAVIFGYDSSHGVHGVILDNVRIAGKLLTGSSGALDIGAFADGITFVKAPK